jgi:hypothetical protein
VDVRLDEQVSFLDRSAGQWERIGHGWSCSLARGRRKVPTGLAMIITDTCKRNYSQNVLFMRLSIIAMVLIVANSQSDAFLHWFVCEQYPNKP